MSLGSQRRILKHLYRPSLHHQKLCFSEYSGQNLLNFITRPAVSVGPTRTNIDCFRTQVRSLTSYLINSSQFDTRRLGNRGDLFRHCDRCRLKGFQRNIIRFGAINTSNTVHSSQNFSTSGMANSGLQENVAGKQEGIKRYMIVGLGNHDIPYTRHSIGMYIVDRIAGHLQVKWHKEKMVSQGVVACCSIPGGSVDMILLKSKKPMNENGRTILKAAKHYKVEASNVYLVHDNLDKPVGKFGIKEGGSARGHNGVRSAIASLKTDVMPRLWIGIDRPADRNDVADYVLKAFEPEERKVVYSLMNRCIVTLAAHIEDSSGVPVKSHFLSEQIYEHKL